MKQKKYRGRRTLLNMPGFQSVAAIAAEIEDTSKWKVGHDRNGKKIEAGNQYAIEPEVIFSISDCYRVIDLSFSFENPGELANNIYKVERLIGALEVFRTALEDETLRFRSRMEILEAVEKEKKEEESEKS